MNAAGSRLRIVSLVPSWTETLIKAGADVVGRTRFCIHPENTVKAIEAIGGTKQFNLEKLKQLRPDVILLDREENTLEMATLAKEIAPLMITHVTNVHQMPNELTLLAKNLAADMDVAEKLLSYRDRFEAVLKLPAPALHNDFPGLLKKLKSKRSPETQFIYVIWREPWMAVGPKTFIASMLEQTGMPKTKLWPRTEENYPKFSIDDVPFDATILFSSEPYPFGKKPPIEFGERAQLLVDGESFSWFGIRSLEFLERAKGVK